MKLAVRPLLVAGALLSGSLAPREDAVAQPGLPSPAACDGWSRALEAGGPGAVRALTEGWLAGCPSVGPSALSGAVLRTRTSTDLQLLTQLTLRGSAVTHPRIFDAAATVAMDAGATIAARRGSLLILSAQLGSGVGLAVGNESMIMDDRMLTLEIPTASFCTSAPNIGYYVPPASEPLPADAPRRVARVFDALRYDTTVPPLVRGLAICLRRGVRGDIPPQVDVGGITLQYLCEDRFRIGNPTAARLKFTYTVEGDPETHFMDVSPHSTDTLIAWSTGTLRLSYDGQLLHEVANLGTPCP